MKELGRRVPIIAAMLLGAALWVVSPEPAFAADKAGSHGAIGTKNKFGLGGHIGSSTGASLKWWFGKPIALQVNAGVHHYWYGVGVGFRAEFDLVWHFSVYTHDKFEMVIGPGVGGGVGFWRDYVYWDLCDTDRIRRERRYRGECWGPFAKGLFHWSMLFHPWKFDVFVEPGVVVAFLPGFAFDWDLLAGARYYF